MYLCREHFQEDVQRKARECLRQTGLFGRGWRMIIELDGGRNSSALAYMLKNTFHRRRDIDIRAVKIDEGEGDAQSYTSAARVAEQLNIPLHRRMIPPPADQKTALASLSARRSETLFRAAQEMEAKIIATGEDLDEEALRIFLEYLQGECIRSTAEGGDMHWIKPLRKIPHREVRLYALILGLGSDTSPMLCPDRLQEMARGLLSEFDRCHPGTNYSLLRGWERLVESGRREAGGKAFK